METIILGQLFLLRRNVKNEISSVSEEVYPLSFHREDASIPEGLSEVMDNLKTLRDTLWRYDVAIEKANAMPDQVKFKELSLSLNEARHLKVHLNGILSFKQNLLTSLERMKSRVEPETVYDPTNNTSRIEKKKFVVLYDLKQLKAEVLALKKDIQLLDSLIQKSDWSLEVSY